MNSLQQQARFDAFVEEFISGLLPQADSDGSALRS